MSSSCHDVTAETATLTGARRVAIAGNPNAGKSTVFNLLTGMRQQVGNYPGVTVERKIGTLVGNEDVELIDLPGSYSLNPRSLDEQIAYDVLAERVDGEPKPDLVVCVVNAVNLERNLYLASQIQDMGTPLVVVLNMMDEAEKAGLHIDVDTLSQRFGAPFIPMIARRGTGLEQLREAISGLLPSVSISSWSLDAPISAAVDSLAELLEAVLPETTEPRRREESLRALNSDRILDFWKTKSPEYYVAVQSARRTLRGKKIAFAQAEITGRYAWLEKTVREASTQASDTGSRSLTQRIDALLLHRVLGPIILAAILLLVFQSIFSWATPVMDLIESGMLQLGTLVRAVLPVGMVADLLVEGVISGVGNVVVFLPQILLLFFYLSLMESTGYMARTAFIMDQLMQRFGLSGGSVMPLMSAYACAVPAIMATRTMDNQRDRFLTIMILPLMSCSARLPVYTLFIAAFIPATLHLGPFSYQGLTMFSLYTLGTVTAFVAAAVLRRMVKGSRTGFVMELPPYRVPQWSLVFWRMIDRAKVFITTAGKVIFLFSIVLWFGASFPRYQADAELESRSMAAASEMERLGSMETEAGAVRDARTRVEAELQDIENITASRQVERSYVGRLGHIIEPVMRPLGFDWKLSAGILTAFAAREVIIGSLGTIYSVANADENSLALRDHLRNAIDPKTGLHVYTPLVAVSLLVFFVLAMQCMSTLAVARREMNSLLWPTVMWIYMTALAYLAALIVYQGGLALGYG